MTRPSITQVAALGTAVLLAVSVGIGWRNQLRIGELRREHERLAAQASARKNAPAVRRHPGATRAGRRSQDREADARRIAAELIAYAMEMENAGWPRDDPEMRRRMIEQTEHLMSLDGAQLKILVREFLAAPDLDKQIRTNLLTSVVSRLTQDYPKDAAEILLEAMNESNPTRINANLGGAIYVWTKSDFPGAREWLGKHWDSIPASRRLFAFHGLLRSALDANPQLTLEVIDEFDAKPTANPVFEFPALVRCAKTPEQRRNLFEVLRTWSQSMPPDDSARPSLVRAIQLTVLGDYSHPARFDFAARLIEDHRFPQKELEEIVSALPSRVNPPEIDRWIDWFEGRLPPASAESTTWKLFPKWLEHDYLAAGQWLATAPEGPQKSAAIRRYIQTVSFYDPDAAAWWGNLPSTK